MTHGKDLKKLLDKVFEAGEIPYQANREAIREFDIFRSEEGGREQLEIIISGIDNFIKSLEELKYEAKRYSLKAKKAVY